jgi:hypothetical protein
MYKDLGSTPSTERQKRKKGRRRERRKRTEGQGREKRKKEQGKKKGRKGRKETHQSVQLCVPTT